MSGVAWLCWKVTFFGDEVFVVSFYVLFLILFFCCIVLVLPIVTYM